MDNSQYRLYEDQCIRLARSILIHSRAAAEQVNSGLMELGIPVDLNSPETWKYYLNLSGQYHVTDYPHIEIVSEDTLEKIVLTRENILSHPETLYSHRVGSKKYNQLVQLYPEREQLIRGIVSPVEISRALIAKEFEIVDYDPTLVEVQELNVIPNLQKWVDGYMIRHHNGAYGVADDLYLSATLGILSIMLPVTIMNLRLANCHTPQAHTFHIWAYLAGFGNLDQYRWAADSEQAHYLYRNMRWLVQNAGTEEAFQSIIEILLKHRGLPLYGYDVRHNLQNMPGGHRPEVETTRFRIEQGADRASLIDTRSPEELLYLTSDLARDNHEVLYESKARLEDAAKRAKSNTFKTKVLESELVNSIENISVSLEEILLNHWVAYSSMGIYNVTMEISQENSGNDLRIKTRDALTLYFYALNRVLGTTLRDIPTIGAVNVRRVQLPSVGPLSSLVGDLGPTFTEIEELIQAQVNVGDILTKAAFSEICETIRSQKTANRNWFERRESLTDRALYEMVVSTLYVDSDAYALAPEATYGEFFARIGFDVTNMTTDLYQELADLLFIEATGGVGANVDTAIAQQRAMIKMMAQLSSYNVQLVGSNAYANTVSLRWNAVRPDDEGAIGLAGLSSLRVPMIVPSNEDNGGQVQTCKLSLHDNAYRDLTPIYEKASIMYGMDIGENATMASLTPIRLPQIFVTEKVTNA